MSVYFRMLLTRFSQQIRYFHRSTFLFARGVRRSNEPPSPVERNLSIEEDNENNSNSIQEQFARLELQRLEHESKGITHDETFNLNDNDDNDGQNLERIPIDPRTTSIILFPGQGTQFVGMG